MFYITFGIVIPWAFVSLGCWLGFQLVKQNGRILLRLEAIEERLEEIAESGANPSSNGHRPLSGSKLNRDGLPAGTPAPDFRLPRIDGGELSLSEYHGKKVLLVFSDPHCGPCDALAPDLEKAHRLRRKPEVEDDIDDNRVSPSHPLTLSPPQILMVSRGEIGENRKKANQHNLTFPIVLQKKWEISKLYAMFATPVGYLIDEEGKTLVDVAVGAESILALLSDDMAKEVAAVS